MLRWLLHMIKLTPRLCFRRGSCGDSFWCWRSYSLVSRGDVWILSSTMDDTLSHLQVPTTNPQVNVLNGQNSRATSPISTTANGGWSIEQLSGWVRSSSRKGDWMREWLRTYRSWRCKCLLRSNPYCEKRAPALCTCFRPTREEEEQTAGSPCRDWLPFLAAEILFDIFRLLVSDIKQVLMCISSWHCHK